VCLSGTECSRCCVFDWKIVLYVLCVSEWKVVRLACVLGWEASALRVVFFEMEMMI